MKANPLALAIAHLTTGGPRYFHEVAQVDSLYDPNQKLLQDKVPVVKVEYYVDHIRIEGEDFFIHPPLLLRDGIVRHVIHTPDFTHVFSVKSDFATANVYAHLQSFEYGSHEYVYMQGEWSLKRQVRNDK